MIVGFMPRGWDDYLAWRDDPSGWAIIARIDRLIREIGRDPFKGIGKPEPLKGDLMGWWSRRIDQEHRLVYQVRGAGKKTASPANPDGYRTLLILTCREHY